MNTTQIGDITEQKFILYCLEHNIPVLKPVGNNLPYDCIIEVEDKLYKIQVKTARAGVAADTFVFNTRSTSKNYNEVVQKDYVGKIDYFITLYNEEFFIVHVEKAGKGVGCLYYGDSPTHNQNLAHKYKFADFVKAKF